MLALAQWDWVFSTPLERWGYPLTPAAVLGSVCAFEVRYDLPAVFSPTPQAAAHLVDRWAFHFTRECVEAFNGLWRAVEAEAPA